MKNARMTICLMATILVMATGQGFGFTQYNDGGTHDIATTINDDIWVDFQTLGMNTTVNLLTGGSIGVFSSNMHNLNGYEDSIINISGGSVSQHLYAYDNSTVTINSGNMYDFIAYDTSHVTMNGGSTRTSVNAEDYGQLTINGGSINGYLTARDNSQIVINGGSISFHLEPHESSYVLITGGFIERDINLYNGTVEILGSDFAIDGVPFGYGELTSLSGGSYLDEPYQVLTGTLVNGDTINNAFYIGSNGRIILAPPQPDNFTLTMAVEPKDVGINTIVPIVGENVYAPNQPIDISANKYINCPDVYHFEHWVGDVGDTNSANTTVFMDSDKTVTAVFTAARVCGDECHDDNIFGDYNHDCIINIVDFAQFALNWMNCTKPECD